MIHSGNRDMLRRARLRAYHRVRRFSREFPFTTLALGIALLICISHAVAVLSDNESWIPQWSKFLFLPGLFLSYVTVVLTGSLVAAVTGFICGTAVPFALAGAGFDALVHVGHRWRRKALRCSAADSPSLNREEYAARGLTGEDEESCGRLKWRIPAALAAAVVLAAVVETSWYSWREPAVARLIRAIEWNNTERASAAIAAGLGHERCFDHTYTSGWFFPIHVAASHGRVEILNQLIEAGADPNQVDSDGQTPIIWLVGGISDLQAGRLASLRPLVQAGANLEAKSGLFGRTALHAAVRYQDIALVRELIALGADVNARRADGNTPLHEACVALAPDPERVVLTLLAAGADPSLANEAAKTPRDLALEEGRTDLAELLSQAGQALPDPPADR